MRLYLDTYVILNCFLICNNNIDLDNLAIDEAFNVGKGANSIISMVHPFFAIHGCGEAHAHLHTNNCTGQNKNRFMVYYQAWRVLAGLHDELILSFLLVGIPNLPLIGILVLPTSTV